MPNEAWIKLHSRIFAAFLLYEAGYDVWLGNYRGTEYSEGHESLNATQREYWDYRYVSAC